MAMGGAAVAAPAGPMSGYYNPAGLADLEVLQVGGLYSEPFGREMGLTYQYVSVLGPIGSQTGSRVAVGTAISWMNLRVGGIQLWGDEGPTGFAEGTGSVYLASFGFRFPGFESVRLGGSLRYYAARLLEGRGTGFGFDLSALWTVQLGGTCVDVGLNVMDLANTTVRWTSLSGETENVIPWTAKAGIAATPIEGLRILGDLDWVGGQTLRDQELHIGVEYRLVEFLAIRGGWSGDLNQGGTFTVGLGVEVAGRLSIEYAYLPPNVFSASHLISATLSF